MSTKALFAMRGVAGLTPGARLILYELGNFANEAGQAWPSLKTLSSLSGYSERRIRNALRELEKKGFIVTRRRKWNANNYTLKIENWDHQDRQNLPVSRSREAVPADGCGKTCRSDRQDLPPTTAKSADKSISEAINKNPSGKGALPDNFKDRILADAERVGCLDADLPSGFDAVLSEAVDTVGEDHVLASVSKPLPGVVLLSERLQSLLKG